LVKIDLQNELSGPVVPVLNSQKSFNVLFINLFPVFWRAAFFCPAGTAWDATAGDGMKRCARCNKKRGVLDRIFGLDKEFCDDCLMVVNQEIRENEWYPHQHENHLNALPDNVSYPAGYCP
jgi:hypothetical protein